MDSPTTPSAGGRRRTEPDAARRLLGRALLAAAVGLFVLFLVLPAVDGSADRGWRVVGRAAVHTFTTEPNDWVEFAVGLTALQATGSLVVVVAALAAGFRTFGRVAASLLLLVSWVVAVYVMWEMKCSLPDIVAGIRERNYILLWFTPFPVLAAAAFVWPRTAVPPE